MLKKILGEDIKESPEEFQEWLSALSKEQLIAEMLRKKESGAWKSDDGNAVESDSGSKNGAKDKGKGKGSNGGRDSNGWGVDASGGGGGGDWGGTSGAAPADADNYGWG
jgi:hypothetical protein